MHSCSDVAKYFLCQASTDDGDLISNLKLQKLVYYAQGFSLALHGEPLFPEPIEAWKHGPVVPALYREYRDFKSDAIPVPIDFDPSIFSRKTKQLLDEVYDVYGQYSAWKLRQLTHSESPWQDNYIEGVLSQQIPLEEMQAYFRDNLLD
ncbi:SocA family protein [Pseudomonas sp. MIL9]|uniref:Panacea domain-containing protein n=1 Tax=Pseudomonas sp. MIL9 TaxID=2807620 RepID=UPI0019521517|nr:type II toxin-antitoxin system antitoxin SocA domain-containing protein [Pseudomonas sp. MIL9]MBM6445292.1 SocA family protein [Pseudomonas sp. MIL9]